MSIVCNCPRARHVHGTRRMHVVHGCPCLPCRRGDSTTQKLERHRRVNGISCFTNGIGSARRLQALAAVGWSADDLAPLLNTSAPNVIRWRLNKQASMLIATRDRIAAVYDEVWDKPPPGRYPLKVQRLAQRMGWLSPLELDDDTIDRDNIDINSVGDNETAAIIDEIAVERAMNGDRVTLTKAERTEAVARLTARGYSAAQIAERLHLSKRTIVRKRAA